MDRIVTHKKNGKTGFYAGQVFQGDRLLVAVKNGRKCRTQWAWDNCRIEPPIEKRKRKEEIPQDEFMIKFPAEFFLN